MLQGRGARGASDNRNSSDATPEDFAAGHNEQRDETAHEQRPTNGPSGSGSGGDAGDGGGVEEEAVGAVGNRTLCADGACSEPSVEEMVDAAVINLDEPCANIPLLRPQELKIIGRCVSFLGETTVAGGRQSMHYEGLVSMITRDTVVLLHVYRFTAEDFAKHREKALEEAHEEYEEDEETQGGAHETRDGDADVTQRERVGVQRQQRRGIVNGMRSQAPSGAAGNGEGALDEAHGIDGLELQDARASAEEFLMDVQLVPHSRIIGSGSLGPVPYMTFSRRRIHNVVFARDPRSSFYSIFRDPTKRHFDMQCLRMFVRRYLVHTGQGNNPRNINLRPFVEWRCNCRRIEENLLLSIAKEELAYLIKTERSMVKAAQRVPNNRRNVLNAYQAPPGLFSETGFLFFTRIPVQTFCLAILQVLVTLMLLSFSSYAFATAPSLVIFGYVKEYTASVVTAGVVSLSASSFTVLHSLRMRLPLAVKLYSIFRFVLVTIAIALNVMAMVRVGEAVSFSHIYKYLYMLSDVSTELCDYYEIHNCTGYGELCEADNLSPICMWNHCPADRNGTCTQPLSASFTRIFVPIVVFSMVLIALFMIDHFLHYRLLQISRLVMAQL